MSSPFSSGIVVGFEGGGERTRVCGVERKRSSSRGRYSGTERACERQSNELEALHEFIGDGSDADARIGREFPAVGGIGVSEDDPQAGAVGFVVPRTNGAG